MKRLILLLILSVAAISCNDQGTSPAERSFNILFRYGVMARNELNTFDDKFTKDLIIDGTITVQFVLTDNELIQIEAKLTGIDFFNYPDTFTVQITDSIADYIDPHGTYIFEVKHEGNIKKLFWADAIMTPSADPKATRLREAIAFIRSIIESRPEYKRLPPVRGGYL